MIEIDEEMTLIVLGRFSSPLFNSVSVQVMLCSHLYYLSSITYCIKS